MENAKHGDIRNICQYMSAWDLLENECVLPSFEDYGADFLDFLRYFDKYECIQYFCIDAETVVVADAINGDVLHVCKLMDFVTEIYFKAFCYEKYGKT